MIPLHNHLHRPSLRLFLFLWPLADRLVIVALASGIGGEYGEHAACGIGEWREVEGC